MSVRKKPERAVPVLLARLSKAKNHALQVVADPELGSKFDDIQTQLNRMTDSLSKIKNWEKKVVDQLCVLEQVLDDDIFSFTDPTSQPQLNDKLILIQQDVTKLKTLISTVDHTLTLKLGGMSFKPTNYDAGGGGDDGRGAAVSQEWTDLGVEAKIVDSDAMSTLCNTFHCLTSQLKMCSLCLSVFPENAPIKKRPLIYWWMGEGLVAKSGDATAEEVGERVFQELLQEGFIKPTTTTDTSSSFVVYPWIRRMLILLAQKAGFLRFTPNGTPYDGQRRAFLWRGNEGEKEDDVLTVLNIDAQYLGGGPEWLRRLQKVEVLQMGRWQDSAAHHIEAEDYKELLNGLGSQKHLKYLSLRGISRIESLPESIAKLISLQILDLRACHNLEKLPRDIAELKNLTHLDVSECYLLETMPKGLERLSSLQVVKGFVVGGNGCRIGDMARLRRLRKLGLRVRSNGNDQLGSLASFEALRILTISWGVESSETTAVSLPTTLTKLDLRCVPFAAVPEWMEASKVPKLEKLYVTGGGLNSIINQEDYPGLKDLRLKYLQPLPE